MAKAKAKAKATGACEPRSDWLKRSSTGARLGAAVESAASERATSGSTCATDDCARARARPRNGSLSARIAAAVSHEPRFREPTNDAGRASEEAGREEEEAAAFRQALEVTLSEVGRSGAGN